MSKLSPEELFEKLELYNANELKDIHKQKGAILVRQLINDRLNITATIIAYAYPKNKDENYIVRFGPGSKKESVDLIKSFDQFTDLFTKDLAMGFKEDDVTQE